MNHKISFVINLFRLTETNAAVWQRVAWQAYPLNTSRKKKKTIQSSDVGNFDQKRQNPHFECHCITGDAIAINIANVTS